jgi:hypothetical protein
MVYIPNWESLAETLTRLMTAGLSMSEAQRDICRALADRKIRFRPTDNKIETRTGSAVDPRLPGILSFRRGERPSLLVPRDLSPDDIDWEKSRPKKPWRDNNGFLVQIGKLEVSTKDVMRVLYRKASSVSPIQSLPADPAEKVVDEPVAAVAPKKKTTAADEARAVKALEAQLEINKHLSAKAARDYCESMGIRLGDRPFRRAWRKARGRKNLPLTARPGRPRKSSR